MHARTASTFLLAALVLSQPALADPDAEKPVAATATSQSAAPVTPAATANAAPAAAESAHAERPRPAALSRDEICRMIESAANDESLPFEFLARLIWQESEFNPRTVSPAGAQGIAQFMPKTARERGLADPFEPATALQESAEFLRELRDQFGNLGLAAAAYNAGPKRVQDWLAKRNTLPRETQNYVRIITGRAPEQWAADKSRSSQDAALESFQCAEIAQLVAQRRNLAALERLAELVAQRMNGRSPAEPRDRARARAVKVAETARSHAETAVEVHARLRKHARLEKVALLEVASRNAASPHRNVDRAQHAGGAAASAAKSNAATNARHPQKKTPAAQEGRPPKLGGTKSARASAARVRAG